MRLSLLAATAALALAFGPSGAQAASPATVLVIGTQLSAVPSLDPAAINARTPSEVVSNLYDNLVMVKPDDLETIRPMLAESWAVSDDKRTITLTLRQGATFVSGNPVTAADAAWTIQRVIKMGQVGSTDIALWGFTKDNVDQLVQAKDDRTLVISLPQPVSTDLVLYSLAGASLGIVDKKTVLEHEQNGDLGQNWLKANSAGSGPYKLTQWRPNDLLLCDARPDYWGGAPGMKRVVMRHIPESGNMRLQIEAGDVDVGQYMANSDIEALKAKGAVIDPGPGLGFYYMALNTQDPDLAKPKVREAFQHILDWKPLAETTMNFNGFPWQSIIPKGMPGAPTGAPDGYQYDPELAKKVLQLTWIQAGEIASNNARYGFVFARRGVVPEAASSWFLSRAVGMSTALEWCFTGRVFDANEALARGLIRSVHAPDELLPAARALAREIADNAAPVSVALTRQLLWRMSGAGHPMLAHRADTNIVAHDVHA